MLTIEEKLNRENSLKWEDEKAKLRKERETVTIEKFVYFFTEKIRDEEKSLVELVKKSLVKNFATRGDFKPKAKIFLNKMRPTGSKSKPFYKPNGEGSNSTKLQHAEKKSASFVQSMQTTILDSLR